MYFHLRYITGSILFGALYDKFNRLTLLIISSFIGAVFQCIQPWCPMFPVMLIVRFIASLLSGGMETGEQFELVSSIGHQLAWKQVSGFKLVSSIGHQLAWKQVSGFKLVSSIGHQLAWKLVSGFKLVSSIGYQLAWSQVSGFKLVSSIGYQLAWSQVSGFKRKQVSGFDLVSSIGNKLAWSQVSGFELVIQHRAPVGMCVQ